MQPDLLVLPHLRPLPPAVAQPAELVHVPLPDPVGLRQPADDRVEVAAVGVEIDGRPVGRPVVLGGEEVRQRRQPPVQVRVVVVMHGARDRMAELLAGVVLDGQHAVDVAADAQRADHVVRRADELVAAQRLQRLVLPACHPDRPVAVPAESLAVELADDLGAAGLLLVPVDLVAAAQPEGAERGPRFAHPHAIADDLAQEAVERVVTREVSDVFSLHRATFPLPVPERRRTTGRRAPPPVARHSFMWHTPRLYLTGDDRPAPDTWPLAGPVREHGIGKVVCDPRLIAEGRRACGTGHG